MTFFWIYDIPNWLLAVLTVTVFSGCAAGGLLATRKLVRRLFGPPPGENEAVSYYLGAFGVFYGLTLGLIAVATWQSFSDLERLVAEEAASLRVLDRSVSWYPSPLRGDLHALLLDYAGFVIEEEWPAQRRGRSLSAATHLDAFERPLMAHEPATAGQAAVHEETLEAYARYLELRGRRSYGALAGGLTAVVWYVLLIGAAITIALTFLFSLQSTPGHLVLTVSLAGFVGLLIFLIAAMDYPYRGEYSVGPEAFAGVRQQMRARPVMP